MATTTPRIRRSPEDWDALAREKLPELQAGKRVSDLDIGTNDEAFRVALARIGFDSRGRPLKLKPITARNDKTLAKRVAERRDQGEPWWRIMAETGRSYGDLNRLLRENGHDGSRNGSRNGN